MIQKRREFIKTVSRGVLFTGLLSLSGYLILREDQDSEACHFDFICQNCNKLNKCTLAEATDYKHTQSMNSEK